MMQWGNLPKDKNGKVMVKPGAHPNYRRSLKYYGHALPHLSLCSLASPLRSLNELNLVGLESLIFGMRQEGLEI